MKNEILYEKWRPKKMEDLILPSRIKDHFRNGITKNYIFYGPYGTGKTSLARILIGKYSGDKAYLEINSSLYTSIEVLRNEIDKFCKTKPMMDCEDGMKYVFLDEFEKVSTNFQDAFKAFVEHYSANNVRFILTTNHLSKLTDAIKKSRFTLLDFEPAANEEREMKRDLYQKLMNDVCQSEGIKIEKDDLIKIINKRFPDNRALYNDLQDFLIGVGGGSSEKNIGKKTQDDLYSVIFGDRDYEKIYHFLMSNFGPERIDKMIDLLGRPFIDYCLENKKEKICQLFEANYIITDYREKLEKDSDPIIVGMTIIGKIQDIMK
jgi:DNA polymerase III delta prime subunit